MQFPHFHMRKTPELWSPLLGATWSPSAEPSGPPMSLSVRVTDSLKSECALSTYWPQCLVMTVFIQPSGVCLGGIPKTMQLRHREV